jgi:hypothetical protein
VAGRPQACNINGCDGTSANNNPEKTRQNPDRLSHFLVPLLASLIVLALLAGVIFVIAAVSPRCEAGTNAGPSIGGVIRIAGCP